LLQCTHCYKSTPFVLLQIPKLTKHKPPPETLYKEPSELKRIEVKRQANRRLAEVYRADKLLKTSVDN